MDWFDRHHIMRRLLLGVFTCVLLIITYKIFCDGVMNLDAFKVSVYVAFSGIITFMLKFYFDSRNIEIRGGIAEEKRENVAGIAEEKRENVADIAEKKVEKGGNTK